LFLPLVLINFNIIIGAFSTLLAGGLVLFLDKFRPSALVVHLAYFAPL